MNIAKATRRFEEWLGQHTRIVSSDLKLKHRLMAQGVFPFFRATFYRWVQVWPELAGDLDHAPAVLAVGDLHVENFGTWRDADGRLVWGINDFDEASYFPYTMDLVRLATSALLAAREEHLAINVKNAAKAILEGYSNSMECGGKPFVLGEKHVWLRQIAESELRDPVRFWQKMDLLPKVAAAGVPVSAREAIEHMLPHSQMRYQLLKRVAGLGSLGHMRFVGMGDWQGGRVAREAKALVPSAICWLMPDHAAEMLYPVVLRNAVRCHDPFVQLHGHWIVRRLSPYCSRIELESLDKNRDEMKLLASMGWETANVHLGTPTQRRAILRDLKRRKGNWLANAAQMMAKAVTRDWQNWKQECET